MVRIAVAGGTGTAGRAVVAEAMSRGYEVRSISRHVPDVGDTRRVPGAEYARADFRSGEGVSGALEDVDALVETLDARSGAALKALPATTEAVLTAAERVGVARVVLLSIVHADQCALGYYQVQAARARAYEAAGLSATVVYATQFHNLLAGIFAAGARVRLIPAFRGVSFQPIAVEDVARVLVDAAVAGLRPESEDRPTAAIPDGVPSRVVAGGPQVRPMDVLARQWKAATGGRGAVVTVPLPGSFGKFLRAGGNLVPEHAVGTLGFTQWLRARRG